MTWPLNIDCPECDNRVYTFPSNTEVTAKCANCGSVWEWDESRPTENHWTLVGTLYPWQLSWRERCLTRPSTGISTLVT